MKLRRFLLIILGLICLAWILMGFTVQNAQKTEYKLFELGGVNRDWNGNVAPMRDERCVPATRDDLQQYARDHQAELIKRLRQSSILTTRTGWNTLVALDTAGTGRVTYMVPNADRRSGFDLRSAPRDTTWALGTLFLGKR